MNLTIKDVPLRLHKKLKSRASDNKRSMNGEVLHILEGALGMRVPTVKEIIKEVETINSRMNLPPLTEEFLMEVKNEGRP